MCMTRKQSLFVRLLNDVNREGTAELLQWLFASGFFEAPASRRDHLCCREGLLTHSINTMYAAVAILANLQKQGFARGVTRESVIVASLLHDVCKADRYVQNEDGSYSVQIQLPVGHGEKSVMQILRTGYRLTDDEMAAIRWHMGPFRLCFNSAEELLHYEKAQRTIPLVEIIHLADSLVANIVEQEKKQAFN